MAGKNVSFPGQPLLKVPWPYLDVPEPAGSSEFGQPTGYRDPDAYRGTAASESLPYALPEGNPNDG